MRATRPVVLLAAVTVALSWPGTWSSGLAATRRAVVMASAGQVSASRIRANTAAPAAIGRPAAQGRLRIAGRLRDGSTVRAAGLRWRTSLVPRGDKLLSFDISYTWQSCAAKCAAAADSTVTPFAARRYVVGHADTRRRLRLTETATEVVETNPATFAFTVVRSSVSTMTEATVRAYPATAPPVTEFVNGTPERRTASDAEYFVLDPPHYNAADGVPVQQYRIDAGSWRRLPASHVFYTGKLALGTHRVQVRTADSAGGTTRAFRWEVVPMPRPVGCRARHGRACWYPPHLNSAGRPMRWDWQIGRVTPLQRRGRRAVDIYDVDGFLTTRAQVHAIHTRWQAATLPHPKLICYIDMAWEDYRPDGSPGRAFPPDTLGNVYYGYPQERWVDFRQLNTLKPMLDERLRMCARKGFDAVELDDIDSFDPPSTTGFHLTPGDAQNFLAYAFNEIHRLGMTGLWKNSPYLSWWGRDYADGAIVEECYVYRQCTAASLRGSSQYGITCTALAGREPCAWDDFSTDRTRLQPTGKWVGEAEYSADKYVCNPGRSCFGRRSFAAFCRNVYSPTWGFAAVKFDVNLDGRMFYPCPAGT
ncbi:MAG TPA: endo alpha-1,4 polygalactosaminidase [Streptosporangiaceae bacterium]